MCGGTVRFGWGYQNPSPGEAEGSKTSLRSSSTVLSFTMISIPDSNSA